MDINLFLLFIASALLITNVYTAFVLLKKKKLPSLDKDMVLRKKEMDLLARQTLFVEAKADSNSKRIEGVEKVLSVLIASSQYDDGTGGITH